MNCPECDDPIDDVSDHIKRCSVKPERLALIGLLTMEELKVINNRNKPKGVSAPLDSKH